MLEAEEEFGTKPKKEKKGLLKIKQESQEAAPTAPTATTAAAADTLLERGVKPTPSNVAIELNHPEIGTNELAGILRSQRAKFGKKTRCAVESVRTWLQGCGTPAWLHSTMWRPQHQRSHLFHFQVGIQWHTLPPEPASY